MILCIRFLEGLKFQDLEGLKFQNKQTQKQMTQTLVMSKKNRILSNFVAYSDYMTFITVESYIHYLTKLEKRENSEHPPYHLDEMEVS